MKAKVLMLSILVIALVVIAIATFPIALKHGETRKASLNTSTKTDKPNYGLIPGFFGGPAIGPDGTSNSGFPVAGGYGYVKIYFKNNASSPVKVVVTHDKTNQTYVAKKIPGKGSYTWLSTDDHPQGVRAGKYTVLFRGGGDGTEPVDVSWRGFTTDYRPFFSLKL
ncbi:hypothetical protein [Paenibacillus sp. SN-8-1]|uniref:hypothetical protein n=1 Tax=Paenibacillus sp. SN-8-1 TaxID=3435409 RepID=UPI003D9A737A